MDPAMTAALTMRAMITAGHRARMIQIAAQLGIADILALGPADSLHLATESGCNADALGPASTRPWRRRA
jgi:hypothetical protein